MKGEMHWDSGFLVIFGTTEQQDFGEHHPLDPHQGPGLDPLGGLAGSGNDLRPLRIVLSPPYELPSSAKGVT